MYSRSLIAFNSHLFTATIAISIHLADHITLLQYVCCLLHTTIWYHSSITTSTLKRKKRKIQCTTEQSTVQVTIQSQKKQESKKKRGSHQIYQPKTALCFRMRIFKCLRSMHCIHMIVYYGSENDVCFVLLLFFLLLKCFKSSSAWVFFSRCVL